MLVNIHHDSPARAPPAAGRGRRVPDRHRAAGRDCRSRSTGRSSTTSRWSRIKADRAGLQLAKFGDVRVNGALVGQVREISQDGEEAEIRSPSSPTPPARSPATSRCRSSRRRCSARSSSPSSPPTSPSGQALQEGDVIPSDRVETNVELEPDPQQPLPAAALGASRRPQHHAQRPGHRARRPRRAARRDAREARRPTSGRSTTHLPTLRKDLVLLAEVADTYNVAAPDLLGVLDNVTVTSRTIIDQRRELDVFFGDVAGPGATPPPPCSRRTSRT